MQKLRAYKKLQSAMEYLMTYGWSILVIAIVLVAVFELGVFNNNPLASSNTCIAQSGFLCSKPILNTTGSLNVTFGQAFGTTYTLTGVACVNSTASPPSTFTYINAVKFYSGETAPLNFKCPLSSNAIGSGFSGELWIQYNTATFSGEAAKVGLVDAKVSTGSAIGSGSVFVNYDVPITLTNLQSTSTGSNFQQMLSINSNQYSSYINGNWMNVEFTTGNALAGSPGTTLQAWVESGASNTATNTVVWVLLPNGIPAQSSTTIYMNFMAGNVMSASGPTGEAPQLSPIYAQYDNGADVFTGYWNFAGNTLPSGWSETGITTYSINNGFTFSSSSSYGAIYTPLSISNSIVSDVLATLKSGSQSFYTGFSINSLEIAGGASLYNGYASYIDFGGSAETILRSYTAAAPTALVSGSFTFTTGVPYLQSTSWIGSTLYESVNYGSTISNTNSLYSTANDYIVGFYTGSSWFVQWARIRNPPPNGVMPAQGTGVGAPSQILYYVPITLTNSQSSAVSAGTQIMIPFDANTYTAYEANNMQNVEFFYGNGTVIPSWLEGNMLNEQQATNLYTATNDIYWVLLNPAIPGSGGTQVIYAGFAPTSTNLFNTATTGEAPQLSSSYGQYDDGASVFGNYQDFAGGTLWSGMSTISGVTLTQNNGLELASPMSDSSNTFYIMTNIQLTSPVVFEDLVTVQNAGGSSNFQEGLVLDSNTHTSFNAGGTPGGTDYAFRLDNSGPYMSILYGSTTLASETPSSLSYPYNGVDSFQQNSTGLTVTDKGNRLTAVTTSLSSGYAGIYSYTSASGNLALIQWLRSRVYPPNGVLPSVSFGTLS